MAEYMHLVGAEIPEWHAASRIAELELELAAERAKHACPIGVNDPDICSASTCYDCMARNLIQERALRQRADALLLCECAK